jgi:hypothetical protein
MRRKSITKFKFFPANEHVGHAVLIFRMHLPLYPFSAMERWSLQHRVFAVEQFLSSRSIVQTQRNFKRHFQTRKSPSRNAILRYVQAFHKRGSVADKPHAVRTVRTSETVLRIQEALTQSPGKSLRRLSQQVGASVSTVHKIVKTDLRLFPDCSKIGAS